MQAVATGLNIFLEFVSWVKKINLTVEYVKEDDGSISGRIVEFCTLSNAPTLEECEAKLIADMRESAELFADNFEQFSAGRPNEVLYVLKILYSTDEELRKCLRGKN
ncbi:MAG: hypothetical protein IJ597_02595 [Synergistaceae bacterium]|nr:hypothetical protein [Synergistaceae bacterium]